MKATRLLCIFVIVALLAACASTPAPIPPPILATAVSEKETRLVALKIDNTLKVGSDTVLADLYTTGNATIAGVLTSTGGFVGNVSLPTGLTATTLTASGAAQLNGGLKMDTNKFIVADTTGDTSIAGTLVVTGLATYANDINTRNITSTGGITTPLLTVSGPATLNNLSVTNGVTTTGHLTAAKVYVGATMISPTRGISITVPGNNSWFAHGMAGTPIAVCGPAMTGLFTYTVYVSATNSISVNVGIASSGPGDGAANGIATSIHCSLMVP